MAVMNHTTAKENLVVYIHGQGGSAEEANYYKSLFVNRDVIGFDYIAQTPWDAKKELGELFDKMAYGYHSVTLIANSIGAFFAMNALQNKNIQEAFFISPVVNMQRLIEDMMIWANVSESELEEKLVIKTDFGQELSWKYLCYVKEHPIEWKIPTHVLYGEADHLTSFQTISEYAEQVGASLTIMENGEHWFHTKEQMDFLDAWIRKFYKE